MKYRLFTIRKKDNFKQLSMVTSELSEIFEFIKIWTELCPKDFSYIIDNETP